MNLLAEPRTFTALVLLVIVGPLLAMWLPAGIFPKLCLSGMAMAWHYTGLPPSPSTAAIVKLALSHMRSALCTANLAGASR